MAWLVLVDLLLPMSGSQMSMLSIDDTINTTDPEINDTVDATVHKMCLCTPAGQDKGILGWLFSFLVEHS